MDEMTTTAHAKAVMTAAAAVQNLIGDFDEFTDERKHGSLTIKRDGVNILQTRADDAKAVLVAGAEIRRHLNAIENAALDITAAAESRREAIAESFFSNDEEAEVQQ